MMPHVQVQCFAREDKNMLIALLHVEQPHPPPGCFSFRDGVMRFAPEDVRRYASFVVRLGTSDADACEYELQSSALTLEAERRITSHEDNPPRLESPTR